ncbi:hypothetical protein Cus16_2992 [Curtobacterium sp. ER1/6]|nr:hypothetical protein Cus16_2992 [Curtobacterium sp. ER1/6]
MCRPGRHAAERGGDVDPVRPRRDPGPRPDLRAAAGRHARPGRRRRGVSGAQRRPLASVRRAHDGADRARRRVRARGTAGTVGGHPEPQQRHTRLLERHRQLRRVRRLSPPLASDRPGSAAPPVAQPRRRQRQGSGDDRCGSRTQGDRREDGAERLTDDRRRPAVDERVRQVERALAEGREEQSGARGDEGGDRGRQRGRDDRGPAPSGQHAHHADHGAGERSGEDGPDPLEGDRDVGVPEARADERRLGGQPRQQRHARSARRPCRHPRERADDGPEQDGPSDPGGGQREPAACGDDRHTGARDRAEHRGDELHGVRGDPGAHDDDLLRHELHGGGAPDDEREQTDHDDRGRTRRAAAPEGRSDQGERQPHGEAEHRAAEDERGRDRERCRGEAGRRALVGRRGHHRHETPQEDRGGGPDGDAREGGAGDGGGALHDSILAEVTATSAGRAWRGGAGAGLPAVSRSVTRRDGRAGRT